MAAPSAPPALPPALPPAPLTPPPPPPPPPAALRVRAPPDRRHGGPGPQVFGRLCVGLQELRRGRAVGHCGAGTAQLPPSFYSTAAPAVLGFRVSDVVARVSLRLLGRADGEELQGRGAAAGAAQQTQAQQQHRLAGIARLAPPPPPPRALFCAGLRLPWSHDLCAHHSRRTHCGG